MGSVCNSNPSMQKKLILLSREQKPNFNEQYIYSTIRWTNYFNTGNALLIDGDGELVELDDDGFDYQWDDDDKIEDEEW